MEWGKIIFKFNFQKCKLNGYYMMWAIVLEVEDGSHIMIA